MLVENLSVKREEAGRIDPVGQSIMKKVLLALALYIDQYIHQMLGKFVETVTIL